MVYHEQSIKASSNYLSKHELLTLLYVFPHLSQKVEKMRVGTLTMKRVVAEVGERQASALYEASNKLFTYFIHENTF